MCTMGQLDPPAQRNKRQKGGWPHLTPRIHKGQCSLAQAVPHHEGLPRLACPRVPGLLPAIASPGPSLEGQGVRLEEPQGPTSCPDVCLPDPACSGLGRQKAALKSGSVSAETFPLNCEGQQSSDQQTRMASCLDGALNLGLFA